MLLTLLLQKGKAKAVIASKKSAAPKGIKGAAPKKMVQTTIKTNAGSKKRPKPDSDDEDDSPPSDFDSHGDGSGFSNTPPSSKKLKKVSQAKKGGTSNPLQDIENESIMNGTSNNKGPPKKKTATDQYQKLTPLQHIIKRPDTYIGSVEHTTEQMWGKFRTDGKDNVS